MNLNILILTLALALGRPSTITIQPTGGGIDVPTTYQVAEDINLGARGRVLTRVTLDAVHWRSDWPSQPGAVLRLTVYAEGSVPLWSGWKMYDGSGSITFDTGGITIPSQTVGIAVRRLTSKRFAWAHGALDESLTDPVVYDLTIGGQVIRACPMVGVAQALTLTFTDDDATR
jgi:hypothetical protein